MLEILTINDFLSLPQGAQLEIQKALKTKDRLENWLRTQNKKQPVLQAEWRKCKVCSPEYPGFYLVKPRNNADVHPSQIDRCIKNLWFSCSGYSTEAEEVIDPRLRMIFDLGHAWHHTIQSYGEKGAWGSGYKAEVEIDPDNTLLPIANDYWIRGSVDGIIDNYIMPNVPGLGDVCIRVVHEYKTISSNGYSKLNRPKPEHLKQATIYSRVFDIPLVVFLYMNKDNCQMADFPVPFDVAIWNEIKAKIERLQIYVDDETPPPWEETSAIKNPRECLECAYIKTCSPPLAKR